MSTSASLPFNVHNHGPHSPSSTAPDVSRGRPNPAHHGNGNLPSKPQSHHRNASLTSNPSSATTLEVNHSQNYWGGQLLNLPTADSPRTVQPSADFSNFEENASHHESSFDDFLTNEASSVNHISEHTTPQELIWEQQFLVQDPQPHILDTSSSNTCESSHGIAESSDIDDFFGRGQDPLNKFAYEEELFDTSSTVVKEPSVQHFANGETVGQAQHSEMHHLAICSNPDRRESCRTLRVETNTHRRLSTDQAVGAGHVTTSTMRARSPVLMVSSYDATEPTRPGRAVEVHAFTKRSRDSEEFDDDEAGVVVAANALYRDANISPHSRRSLSGDSRRAGLEPQQRGDDTVTSIKEREEQRHIDEKNAEVQTWLASSDAETESTDAHPLLIRQNSRSRFRTIGGQLGHLSTVGSDLTIPGPGLLVEVDIDDEYFDDESITSSQKEEHTEQTVGDYHTAGSPLLSPRALQGRESSDSSAFPALDPVASPEEQEPLPHQFYKRGPWQDPVQGPASDEQSQPNSSSAAAYKFNQEAAKWETASRAATWGTRRRLSESEIRSIVDGSQVRHLSLTQRGRERGHSFLNKARGLLPRRSSSNIKPEPSADNESAMQTHSSRGSIGTIKPAHRIPSFGTSRSPPLDTGMALIAMTGQLAAVGRGNSVKKEPGLTTASSSLQTTKKHRSKSDVSKSGKSSTPGLKELWGSHGGPPMLKLASPVQDRESSFAAPVIDNDDAQADDDEDELADEVAIRMDLNIRAEEITPTVEGFKDHAGKLNPRLEPFLLDRIGQEQVRRYKKLVETKIKHTQAVQTRKMCASGKHCFELGGEATLLAPRASSRDPETTRTQFQVSNTIDNEIDESGFTEGVVTPALFPPGIPLPPVKRLPAEFECPLCFKVKKFQKPSDWTKHVHEDIQPFSCTFPNCSEAKSFKRKADWVRHENERHRHLEWWTCSSNDCAHICYRKDNFVQHLVREHKMTEPKIKNRGSSSSKIKPADTSAWDEDNAVVRMIESCRHETTKKPRDEPCRFCGNVCSSFKKLSVHMGKHMEQIAMPVLDLVDMRQVTPDTIISPVEQPQAVASSFTTLPGTVNALDMSNLSPYPVSATSAYQTSSAGQSPASMHGRMQNGGFQLEQSYYPPHTMASTMQGQTGPSTYGVAGGFSTGTFMSPNEYVQSTNMQQQHEHNLSPHTPMMMSHAQQIAPGYGNTSFVPPSANYSQPTMQSMYTNTPTMQGYMPQYAASVTGNRSSNHSPLGMNHPTGLGMHTMNPQYGYSGPGTGGDGSNMHFPS
ncbi:hypothetical protein EDD37DRAFT_273248 [Exophiala viscosa]|uniref:C2H2-type domain-containing protein n=1 Tax=Exophiala viscosa TaxID=2486360 RepID=A0AAN6IIB0_9EURO|nr:hypothetical protein EDD36DRAFT_35751 [Exophiala viscosa]KAI1627708.1 hypothetical protein EDD37DRAFT_273248 [Exophiala viscosa]